MQCRYIGHAGWLFESNKVRVLCDPWLNPNGAYYSSWFQFPPIEHIDVNDVIGNIDILYISHTHADHLDKWTLQKIDKNVQVIIYKFRDPHLKIELRELGFKNIIELQDGKNFIYKHLQIRAYGEEDHHDKDSCLLIEDGQNKILNLNDCHLSPKIVKEIAPVDLLLLQFSGALWWPAVYDYDEKKMKKLSTFKRKNTLKRAVKYAKWSKAKFVIPAAGPPAFLDSSFSFWNNSRRESFNYFPLMDEGVEYFKESGVDAKLVMTDDVWKIDDDLVLQERSFTEDIYDNLNNFMEIYYEVKQPIIKKSLNLYNNGIRAIELLKKRVIGVIENSKIYKSKVNYPILIQLTGRVESKLIVNFSESKWNCVKEYDNEKWRYKFVLDSDFLADILEKRFVDFDEYFLSCKFKASRDPDEFDDFLFAILRNMDPTRLKISEKIYAEKSANKEFFDVEWNGNKFQVQKYCPHMLADLSHAGEITADGQIVCGMHNWKFDLRTGACSNSKKRRLCVKMIK